MVDLPNFPITYHWCWTIKRKQKIMSMMDGAMSAGQSNYYDNRQFLLKTIMNQLGLTEEDLQKNPSEIKQIVREANIDAIVND
jgi:hypothetical protein